MKNLQQMLRALTSPGVVEFAMASDRLACVKIGGKYEPIDDVAWSTEAIVELLIAAAGRQRTEGFTETPVVWTLSVEGVGPVAAQVVMRNGRVQARFALVRSAVQPTNTEGAPVAAVDAARHRSGDAEADPSEVAPAALQPSPRRPDVPSVTVSPATARSPGVRTETPLAAIADVLALGRDAGASDLHLVAGRPILLRLGGDLVPRGAPIGDDILRAMVEPIVPERLRGVLADEGSCDFAHQQGDLGRFRVNVSKQRTGLKACFRCIPATVPTLASLGLPPEIERATHHHQGLVLVTGPTGHGKTSTMAAIVDIINANTTHHIITVEDPVEYLHPRKRAMMSQREVGTHTRSFAAALKASLREDPDVIVVGELRDSETVRTALAASETGHLVLGTINTPSAAKTIDRLVDLFPPGDQQQVRMTLAGGLHLIVSQRLVPAADGKGMVAAVELLPGSIALWTLIRDAKTFQIPSLQQRGKGFGIVRLDDSLLDLVRSGRITAAVALATAENPDDLEATLAGKRAPPGAPPAPKPEHSPGLLGKAGQMFGKRGP
jgi:twitching motility protein PilT